MLNISPDELSRRLDELEDRIEQLEAGNKVSYAARLLRRTLRLSIVQPPLWRFWQYSARTLSLPDSYAQQVSFEDPPSFAIVTPSYNQASYLQATIDSILEQNYPNVDYIVQDGGSDDGSVSILQSYGEKLKWASEKDNGQAEAINRGFQKVTGEIMGYLNSDDLLLQGTLAYVAQAFLDNPEVDFVYGHRVFIDSEGYDIGRAVLPAHNPEILKWADYVPQETMFWRRAVWDEVGNFNEDFRYALDWDFILRAQAAGFRFLRLPRFLACFRVHDAQKTTAIRPLGKVEMTKLRKEHIGHVPSSTEIARKLQGYLYKQMLYHWAYKLNLLKH